MFEKVDPTLAPVMFWRGEGEAFLILKLILALKVYNFVNKDGNLHVVYLSVPVEVGYLYCRLGTFIFYLFSF